MEYTPTAAVPRTFPMTRLSADWVRNPTTLVPRRSRPNARCSLARCHSRLIDGRNGDVQSVTATRTAKNATCWPTRAHAPRGRRADEGHPEAGVGDHQGEQDERHGNPHDAVIRRGEEAGKDGNYSHLPEHTQHVDRRHGGRADHNRPQGQGHLSVNGW